MSETSTDINMDIIDIKGKYIVEELINYYKSIPLFIKSIIKR